MAFLNWKFFDICMFQKNSRPFLGKIKYAELHQFKFKFGQTNFRFLFRSYWNFSFMLKNFNGILVQNSRAILIAKYSFSHEPIFLPSQQTSWNFCQMFFPQLFRLTEDEQSWKTTKQREPEKTDLCGQLNRRSFISHLFGCFLRTVLEKG